MDFRVRTARTDYELGGARVRQDPEARSSWLEARNGEMHSASRGSAAAMIAACLLSFPVSSSASPLISRTPAAQPSAWPIEFALVLPRWHHDELFVRAATPVADCRDLSNPDRAIAACTVVNASKNLARRTRASALVNRCAAYQNKGMLD